MIKRYSRLPKELFAVLFDGSRESVNDSYELIGSMFVNSKDYIEEPKRFYEFSKTNGLQLKVGNSYRVVPVGFYITRDDSGDVRIYERSEFENDFKMRE